MEEEKSNTHLNVRIFVRLCRKRTIREAYCDAAACISFHTEMVRISTVPFKKRSMTINVIEFASPWCTSLHKGQVSGTYHLLCETAGRSSYLSLFFDSEPSNSISLYLTKTAPPACSVFMKLVINEILNESWGNINQVSTLVPEYHELKM